MRLRIAVVATALAVVSVLEAQSVDPALTAAIAGRDKASIDRDAAGLGKYTADDYVAVNPNGVLNTKQQRLAGLKAPAAPGAKPQPPLRTEAVRMYGAGAAVVRMRQVDHRQLAIWIKNPSGWQMTAIHVVPDAFTPQPPPQTPPKTALPTVLNSPAGLTGDRAAVFATFKQIQEAVDTGDPSAAARLRAQEFVRLSPGMLRFGNENTPVAGLRVPPKYSNITVQTWGELGVVRWHEVSAAGQQQWFTRVFAKNAAGWQQVATASSLSGNPPIAP
jgi:Domain of unknown function (DUF4440)